MVRSFSARAVWATFIVAGLLLALSAAKPALADEPAPEVKPATDANGADGQPLEFFKAIEDQQIEAILIPRDAKGMVLQVINKTDRPLTIQAPRVFAGVPVLEQVLPRNNNANNKNVFGAPNAASDKAPQKLVGQFNVGNRGQNGMNNGPNGNRANAPFGNALFNIPPEKTLRFTIACVCIEHGKPNPGPHFPYEIRPLDSATDKPQIGEVVERIGSKYSQRVAQIAAWHFSNDLSWDQLAELKITHANGAKVPEFTSKEIEQAKQLVAELPSTKAGNPDKPASGNK